PDRQPRRPAARRRVTTQPPPNPALDTHLTAAGKNLLDELLHTCRRQVGDKLRDPWAGCTPDGQGHRATVPHTAQLAQPDYGYGAV
ncbi:hypothetical protein, partial [Frankia nepalensis]|uniref:hypothetical protein n=1 Tax=Frankia nepalensis TaxID=1836974 RepID=UPI001EE40E11